VRGETALGVRLAHYIYYLQVFLLLEFFLLLVRERNLVNLVNLFLLAGERDLVDLVDFFLLLGVSPREIYKSYKLLRSRRERILDNYIVVVSCR